MLRSTSVLIALALLSPGAARADGVDDAPSVPFLPGQGAGRESTAGVGGGAIGDALYVESVASMPLGPGSSLDGGAWALAQGEVASGGWLGLRAPLLASRGLRLSSTTFLLASSDRLGAPARLGLATGIEGELALPVGVLRPYGFLVGDARPGAVVGASYSLRLSPAVALVLAGGVGVPLVLEDGAVALSSAYALAAVELAWRSWSLQVGGGVAAGGAGLAALAPTYLDSEHLFPAHAERRREDVEELRFSPFAYAILKPKRPRG